jgi:hypothetical protein
MKISTIEQYELYGSSVANRLSHLKKSLLALMWAYRFLPIYLSSPGVDEGSRTAATSVLQKYTEFVINRNGLHSYSESLYQEAGSLWIQEDVGPFQPIVANNFLLTLYNCAQFLDQIEAHLFWSCYSAFRSSVGEEKFGRTSPGNHDLKLSTQFYEVISQDKRCLKFHEQFFGDISFLADSADHWESLVHAAISRAREQSWSYEEIGPRAPNGALIP